MVDVRTELIGITKKRKDISKKITQLKQARGGKDLKYDPVRRKYVPAKTERELQLEQQLRSLNEQEKSIKMQERSQVISQERREEGKETRQKLVRQARAIREAPDQTISQAERKGELIQEYKRTREKAEAKRYVKPKEKTKEYTQPVMAGKQQKEETYYYVDGEKLTEKQFKERTAKQFREELFRKQKALKEKKKREKTQMITDVPIIQYTKAKRKAYEKKLLKKTEGKTEEQLLSEGLIRRTTKEDISIAPAKYAYTKKALGITKKTPQKNKASIGAAEKEVWGTEQTMTGTRGGGVISIGKYEAETQDASLQYQKNILSTGLTYALEKKEAPKIITKIYEKISGVSKGWLEVAETAPLIQPSITTPFPKAQALNMAVLTAGSAAEVIAVKTAVEHPVATALTIGTFGIGGAAVQAVAGEKVAGYATTAAIGGMSAASYVFNPPKTKYEAIERAWGIPILIGTISAIKQTPALARKAKQTLYKDVEVKRLAKAEITTELTVGRELAKKQEVRLYESQPTTTRVLGPVGKMLRELGVPIKGRTTMPHPQTKINIEYQQITKTFPSKGGVGTYVQTGKGKLVRGKEGYDFIQAEQPKIQSFFEVSTVTGKQRTPFKLPPPKSYIEHPTVSVKGYTYTKKGKPTLYTTKNIKVGENTIPFKLDKKIIQKGYSGVYYREEDMSEGIIVAPSSPTRSFSDTLGTISHEVGHKLSLAKPNRWEVFEVTKDKGGYRIALPKRIGKEYKTLVKKGLVKDYDLPTDQIKTVVRGSKSYILPSGNEVKGKMLKFRFKSGIRDVDEEVFARTYSAFMQNPSEFRRYAPTLYAKYAKEHPAMWEVKGTFIKSPVKTVEVGSYTRPGKFRLYPGRDLPARVETLQRKDKGIIVKGFEKVIKEKPKLVETAKTEAIPIKIPRPKKDELFKKAIAGRGAIRIPKNYEVKTIGEPAEGPILALEYRRKGLFGKEIKGTAWIETKGKNSMQQVVLQRLKEKQRADTLQLQEVNLPLKVKQAKPITSVISKANTIGKAKLKPKLFYVPKNYVIPQVPQYARLSPLAEQQGYTSPNQQYIQQIRRTRKQNNYELFTQQIPSPARQKITLPTHYEIPQLTPTRSELDMVPISITRPFQNIRPVSGVIPKAISKPKYEPAIIPQILPAIDLGIKPVSKVEMRVKQEQRIVPEQMLRQKLRVRPAPEPPEIPWEPWDDFHTQDFPLFFPFPKIKLSGRGRTGKKIKKKQKYEYRPTLFSISTGYKGKPILGGVESGLGLRPIKI